ERRPDPSPAAPFRRRPHRAAPPAAPRPPVVPAPPAPRGIDAAHPLAGYGPASSRRGISPSRCCPLRGLHTELEPTASRCCPLRGLHTELTPTASRCCALRDSMSIASNMPAKGISGVELYSDRAAAHF